ncbi:hypothetical protein [Nesterenkonia xinjiangensis]|uniref:Membrane-associated HD superfamily phosphohydrolase n=1 Tax=Nesterenkonia xinjiangensis TaxID=225327 RepID=A0A7Z0GQ77_9MICC|nr:hypothetical protein [Nesterenkonia xinjiangensis]NYJ79291.1 membrane-associated HD superfamily phosphohydrolase [Nesterenkonia xinjiangensis]
MRRRARLRLAQLLTDVLSPSPLIAVLLVQVAVLTDPLWWWASLIAVTFLAVVPWAIILVLVRRGAATDRYVRHRSQRHLVYALALGSMLLGTALLLIIPTTVDVRLAAGLGVGTLLAVMVVNTRVKISVHAILAALTGLVVPAGLPGDTWWALGAACWMLVCWARLVLQRHSALEVMLGSLLGVGVGAAFLTWAPHYPG